MEQNTLSSSIIDQITHQDGEIDDKTIEEFGISDEEFKNGLINDLKNVPGRKEYATIFEKSIDAIVQWRKRYRGNPTLWKRLFKKDRVIKELVEAVPIIQAVMAYVSSFNSEEENGKRITIMDLCSGKGYLSMFLSELLPPEKIVEIILIDKAWPPQNIEFLQKEESSSQKEKKMSEHINWDHIYGTIPTLENSSDNPVTETLICRSIDQSNQIETYLPTWPIR